MIAADDSWLFYFLTYLANIKVDTLISQDPRAFGEGEDFAGLCNSKDGNLHYPLEALLPAHSA